MVDGRVETAEEKRRQHGAVEFVAALYRRFQPIDEKSPDALNELLVAINATEPLHAPE